MYEVNQRFACWLIGLLLFVVGATVVASDALSRIPNEIYRLPRVRQQASTMVVPSAYQDDVPPIIVQDEDQYFSDLEPPADVAWPTPDQVNDPSLLNSNFDVGNPSLDVGDDFYAASGDFGNGVVIRGKGVAMKIGGYVKANLTLSKKQTQGRILTSDQKRQCRQWQNPTDAWPRSSKTQTP